MALKVTQTDPLAIGERWEKFQDDVEFKIAGLDRSEYQIALDRARRLISRADASQKLSNITVGKDDRSEHDVQCDLLGRFIVLDWKGSIEDESGARVSYSPELASKLLKGNVELFAWVVAKAATISHDARTETAEAVGKP